MEGGQRNTTLGHTVDEGVDGGLGVLGTDLKGDMAAVVDQYAIPIGGHVERDVLVALFGSSAAILIPDVDALAVLDVRAEAFAQAIHVFTNRQMQLDGNEHVGFITGGTVHGHTEFADRLGGDVRFGTELESAQRLACGLSEHLAVLADEGQVPGGALDDLRGKSASGQRDVRAIDADFAVAIAVRLNGHVITVAGFVGIERESGVFGGALPVFGTHTNHAFCRRGDVHIECGQVQGIVSAAHHGGRGEDVEAFGGGIRRQFVGFTSVEGVDAVTNHPVAVGELHCCCSLVERWFRPPGNKAAETKTNMYCLLIELPVVRMTLLHRAGGDTAPVAGAHHALLTVLAGVGQGTGDNLVPAIFGHVIVEVGEQALAGEQTGRGVALVVFHNVRSVVGVEDLGGVLANLFEGLLLEFDLDAGLTHFHALCKKCEAYAHFPSNAQVQEWQQFAIFEITMCV